MGLKDFLQEFENPLSRRASSKIENLRHAGYFTEQEVLDRGMKWVLAKESEKESQSQVCFYLLIDPSDGCVVDCRFQAFGSAALLIAAEAFSELLISKHYNQARRIGADLIDKHLRDHPDIPAFPEKYWGELNLVIDALEAGLSSCTDLPQPSQYISPVPEKIVGEGIKEWDSFSKEQKIAALEALFDEEIRPYIELDAGGIKIMDLNDENEILISYQGACTSCYSSVGSTLTSIQQIVQVKIHPALRVVPNLDDLLFTQS